MEKTVEMPTKAMMTMVVDNDNHAPFQLVPSSKLYKKAKPNPTDAVQVNHKFEINIRIMFTHVGHSGSKFNVATHAKKLFLVMLHCDNSIAIKQQQQPSLLLKKMYKEQFYSFFHVHAPTNICRNKSNGHWICHPL